MPKNSCEESVKERRKDWHLYESRAKCLRSIVDGLKTKNWISLSGSIGLGKHIISQEVSKEFEMNDYLTIHINALSNNLISNFCCEVTKGLFGAEIGDLVSLVQDDDEYIDPMLNNEERNRNTIEGTQNYVNNLLKEKQGHVTFNDILDAFDIKRVGYGCTDGSIDKDGYSVIFTVDERPVEGSVPYYIISVNLQGYIADKI